MAVQVQLSNGFLMPTIGFGTAGLGGGTFQAVASALSVGYQLLDTAQVGTFQVPGDCHCRRLGERTS